MTVVSYLGGYRIRISVEIKRRFYHFNEIQASTWHRPLCVFFRGSSRGQEIKNGGSGYNRE